MTFPIFDSHCHLDAADFDADRETVVERALAAGVCGVVVPATSLASAHATVAMVASLNGLEGPNDAILSAYAAVGVHPHDAREVDAEAMLEIEKLSESPRVVAIGETGLDYHYNLSPPEIQRASLREHVRLAVRRKLPLVLHNRDSEADMLVILEEEGAAAVGGVMHCFTADQATADRLLAMGFHIGFTGIVTFRNADALREVVRRVPLDRILLETDSPYLAPVPYRGKRNEPSFLPRVAEAVAALHGVSPEEVAARALENTRRCFGLAPMEAASR